MASTNKTTHYNLSQYVGTDKPTYLVDYNQDMSRIDTGIYDADAKAVVNATNIGDLSNLTTTDKLSLVNAINEVNSESSTVGNLSDLTTTSKTSVVSAINEVNEKANTIGDLTDLTTADKSEIVDAINEVNGKTATIGTLSSLTTTDKTSVVNAINEVNGNVGTLSSLTTTDKTSVVSAINEVNEMKEVILWTNPNPTSNFTAGSITLSSGDYDEYEVIYASATSDVDTLDAEKSFKGKNCILFDMQPTGTVAPFRARKCEYVDSTHLSFNDAYYGKDNLANVGNQYIIPIYVIGHKSHLTIN